MRGEKSDSRFMRATATLTLFRSFSVPREVCPNWDVTNKLSFASLSLFKWKMQNNCRMRNRFRSSLTTPHYQLLHALNGRFNSTGFYLKISRWTNTNVRRSHAISEWDFQVSLHRFVCLSLPSIMLLTPAQLLQFAHKVCAIKTSKNRGGRIAWVNKHCAKTNKLITVVEINNPFQIPIGLSENWSVYIASPTIMFTFTRNRKLSRDEFRVRSKKRFNFLHILNGDKKKDLDAESFITGEKVPAK